MQLQTHRDFSVPRAVHRAVPLGRLLQAAIFVTAGINKLQQPAATEQYMSAKMGKLPIGGRLPALRRLAAFAEIGGGLSVLLGLGGRWGATALASFLVPTTFLFHDFWTQPAGMQRQDQQIQFLKNLAILGGLLQVIGHGTGRASLDRRLMSRIRARAPRAVPTSATETATGGRKVIPQNRGLRDWLASDAA